jgi:hypothetical protein
MSSPACCGLHTQRVQEPTAIACCSGGLSLGSARAQLRSRESDQRLRVDLVEQIDQRRERESRIRAGWAENPQPPLACGIDPRQRRLADPRLSRRGIDEVR